eukprot:3816036-Ditylum_brightwellii.AAC.1
MVNNLILPKELIANVRDTSSGKNKPIKNIKSLIGAYLDRYMVEDEKEVAIPGRIKHTREKEHHNAIQHTSCCLQQQLQDLEVGDNSEDHKDHK